MTSYFAYSRRAPRLWKAGLIGGSGIRWSFIVMSAPGMGGLQASSLARRRPGCSGCKHPRISQRQNKDVLCNSSRGPLMLLLVLKKMPGSRGRSSGSIWRTPDWRNGHLVISLQRKKGWLALSARKEVRMAGIRDENDYSIGVRVMLWPRRGWKCRHWVTTSSCEQDSVIHLNIRKQKQTRNLLKVQFLRVCSSIYWATLGSPFQQLCLVNNGNSILDEIILVGEPSAVEDCHWRNDIDLF
jgi:hypothetical protein